MRKRQNKKTPKLFLILDSLGNLASLKEKTDAQTGNTVRDMTKQQVIRTLFRTATIDLAANKIPFVITNHTYQGIGMFAKKEISGGGGIAFNPSIVLMLGKAKLKETNDESKKAEMNSTGIIVTSRPRKNRFAKPIPIKFHISFFKGMNKYTGLEKYITWDSAGIAKGDLITQAQYDKWGKEKKAEYDYDRYSWEHNGKRLFFIPRDSVRSIVVKHLGKRLPKGQLFTPEVLTDELLRKIDDEQIKPLFMLPDINSLDDLEELEIIDETEE